MHLTNLSRPPRHLRWQLPNESQVTIKGIVHEESTILKSAMMPVKLVCRRLDDSVRPRPPHQADATVTPRETPAGRAASCSRAGAGGSNEDAAAMEKEGDWIGKEAEEEPKGTHTVLLKTSQDLRRDQLIVSLIELMDMLLKREGVRDAGGKGMFAGGEKRLKSRTETGGESRDGVGGWKGTWEIGEGTELASGFRVEMRVLICGQVRWATGSRVVEDMEGGWAARGI